MDTAVIVHRWFERGAGWAYAPQAGENILAIMSALDSHLKAGKPGRFQVRLDRNKYLVGTVANDPECADPKARERKPTILRAAILHSQPAPAQEQAISELLSQIWPTQPGPDRHLVVTDHPGALPQGSPTVRREIAHPMKKNRNGILIMLAILAVCIIALGIFLKPASESHDNAPEADLQSVATKMADQLAHWGVQVKDNRSDAVITRYCAFLSKAELGTENLKPEHPYVRFVKRLPQTPAKAKNGQWTEQEVEAALRALVVSLDQPNPPPAAMNPTHSLELIAQLMSYEDWRNHSHRTDPDGAFSVGPDDAVAAYVERFRKGESNSEAAQKMRGCLREWHVEVTEGTPTFTVLRLFFQTLRRPSERMEGLTEADMGHAYWKFMARLPEVSCKAWTGDSDKEVEDGLAEVLRALKIPTANQPVPNWIDRIKSEMDYDKWLGNQDGKEMQKNGKPGCQKLCEVVNHFLKRPQR